MYVCMYLKNLLKEKENNCVAIKDRYKEMSMRKKIFVKKFTSDTVNLMCYGFLIILENSTCRFENNIVKNNIITSLLAFIMFSELRFTKSILKNTTTLVNSEDNTEIIIIILFITSPIIFNKNIIASLNLEYLIGGKRQGRIHFLD